MRYFNKFKFSRVYYLIFLFGGVLSIVLFYHTSFVSHLFFPIYSSPQEYVKKQLLVSAVFAQSVWDQNFLNQHPIIKERILSFEKGDLCKDLKDLDTENLSHIDLQAQLKKRGFSCVLRPLVANPFDAQPSYLKIDQTITFNPNEEGIAYQEICNKLQEPICVIRFKRDGFPLHRRLQPHSTKAVLLDGTKDGVIYANEAFKITAHGRAVPKGPHRKHGLKKCPYYQRIHCHQWVDEVMTHAHPTLKDPVPTVSKQ